MYIFKLVISGVGEWCGVGTCVCANMHELSMLYLD